MLVIRLQRTGRTNLATYRIVVAEKARSAKGKFQEIVGHYLPTQKDGVFESNTERIAHWISMGAIPSDTVARLLKKNGMKGMEKFIKVYTKRKPKKEPPEAPTPAPVAAPAVAEDVSASESEVASTENEKPVEETSEKESEEKSEDKTPDAPLEESKEEEAPTSEKNDSEGESDKA